ncbi:MAG: hypothetical protein MH204_01985 [Fimbriimonadaceae bacterium]|nr:hypothetical protein [Fimbriimonadaceae bacterium]
MTHLDSLKLWAMFAMVLAVLVGCGGSGSTAGDVLNRNLIVEDDAAMDEGEVLFTQYLAEDEATALERLETALKANPKFRNVERTLSLVKATLPSGFDGAFLIPSRGGNPDRGPVGGGRSPIPGTVPVSGRALFVASFGKDPYFNEYGRELAPIVRSSGYKTPPEVLLGTVADYMTLPADEIGLLYVDAHGYLVPNIRENSWWPFLVTYPMDYEKEGKPYLAELYRTAGPTDFMMIRSKLWDPEREEHVSVQTVGLGPGWLTRNLKFSKDSLVFMNTCYGDYLGDAMLKAGATVSIGWNAAVADVDANAAARRFFGLTAGIDGSRATWTEAKAALTNEKLDVSKQPYFGTATLKYRSQTESVSQILPEIDSVSTDSSKDEITLLGSFGNGQGMVYSTDSNPPRSLAVVSWSRTKVVAKRGGSVPGVYAVSVGGLKSNTILMEGWKFAGASGGKFLLAGTLTISVGPTPREEDLRVLVTNNYGPTPALRDPILLKPVLTSSDRYLVLKVQGAGGKIDPLPIWVTANGRSFSFPHPGYYWHPDTNEFQINGLEQLR